LTNPYLMRHAISGRQRHACTPAERFVDEPVPSDSDERAAPYRPSCGEDGKDGLLVVPVDGGGAGGEEVLAIEGDGHLWKGGRRSEHMHARERKCSPLRATVTCGEGWAP
jgi:hypothetical protein